MNHDSTNGVAGTPAPLRYRLIGGTDSMDQHHNGNWVQWDDVKHLFPAGVPAFDATKPCVLTTADPARTYCERCKNPHHACDHAAGVAPTRPTREEVDNLLSLLQTLAGGCDKPELALQWATVAVEKLAAAAGVQGTSTPVTNEWKPEQPMTNAPRSLSEPDGVAVPREGQQ